MIQNRICKQCGRSFQGGPRAYYCHSCRYERRIESNRRHKQNKRAGDIRPIGSIDKCELCGKDYDVAGGQQRFCLDCKQPHYIEHDRKTGLEYYTQNKLKINPVRNDRRRNGTIKCEWCMTEFEVSTRATTCSYECRRKLRNKKWVDRYRNNKSHP